jgi:hypothetical protein
MGDSPFRDDTAALRSTLFELERENEELHAEVKRLREELEAREAPENVNAVIQRLVEDNEELRSRVNALEAVRDMPPRYNRTRVDVDFVGGLEALWAWIVARKKT